MPNLNIEVLSRRARELAAEFTADKQDGQLVDRVKFNKSLTEGDAVQVRKASRDHIMLQLYNLRNKDEYEFIVNEMRSYLGKVPMIDFNSRIAKHEPRA